MPTVLLIDDEERFRTALSERLTLRGYDNFTLPDGTDAVKTVRQHPEVDVVLLDRSMPGASGEHVLREIKQFRPELQVVMLTGHGSLESAMETGRLEAYAYLQKPCDLDRLIQTIEAARRDKETLLERHQIAPIDRGSFRKWFVGAHNYRPGFILLGLAAFAATVLAPPPARLLDLVSTPKAAPVTNSAGAAGSGNAILGYAGYRQMAEGDTIAAYYSRSAKLDKKYRDAAGETRSRPLTPEEAAFRAKVMLGILVVAGTFWATGAVPVGITALLVGVFMYFLGVLRPDDIAAAYAKDAVVFVFGVLAVAMAIGKTGLDRRIGLLLLGPSTSLARLMFLFLPMMGLACSFLSEHALVAFVMPLFIVVYATSVRAAGLREDRALAVMLVLSLSYAANSGGPGSPAAGGRNAVMMAILGDYGTAPSFGEWVELGLPFVPVMTLVVGAYFYLAFRKKVKVRNLNVSAIVAQAAQKIGPMNRQEYLTAGVLVVLVALWVFASDILGMGGPVLLAIVLLNLFRVLSWNDVAKIHWEVVALYASACALGKGLASTGAALYMADVFVSLMPEALRSGAGLAISASLFTGICTQFMSDGATVSAIGPIVVPMATLTGSHPWAVGLAAAFASSFAHMMIIGTPNNAIAYAMAKDPVTGKQLVTLADFLRHGFVVLLLSWAVLWGFTILVYWRWIGM